MTLTTDLASLDAANKALQADKAAAKSTKAFAATATQVMHDLAGSAPTPPATGRWFPDSAYPNVDRTNAPVDPSSVKWIGTCVAACQGGFYWNTDAWSTPVYLYDAATTPTVTVKVDPNSNPTPTIDIHYLPSFKPSPDGIDGHLTVVDKATMAEVEFQAFNPNRNPDGTYSAHSYALMNLATGNGMPTSGRVAVCSFTGGLTRPSEVAAGTIPHYLRAAIPCMSTVVRKPASASDGNNPNGPPAGAILRLKASFDTSHLSVNQQMQCAALKRYGMVIADSNGTSDVVSLYAESTTDGSSYPGGMDSLDVSVLAAMEVLAT